MTCRMKVSGLEAYYEALESIFRIHSDKMTKTLPHLGERGRNSELLLRGLLKKILPKRFGVGTGFVVSSDDDREPSSQTDIVIHDRFWNAPLFSELAAEVYPIESVYATIEVKGQLAKSPRGNDSGTDFDRTLSAIEQIRMLASTKEYDRWRAEPISHEETDKKIMRRESFRFKLCPRSYIFAIKQKGWRDLEQLKMDLVEGLIKYPRAHVNGIAVLENNWFAFVEPHTRPDFEVHTFNDNSLLRFILTVLRGVQSFPMYTASIDSYARVGLWEGVCSGFPGDSGADPEPFDEYDDDMSYEAND